MRRTSILSVILLTFVCGEWSFASTFALKQTNCNDTGESVILTSVPFNYENRTYLVTPLQLLSAETSTSDYCYSYQSSQGQWQNIEFRGVDWPYLAVFESSKSEVEPKWELSPIQAPMAISAVAVDRETLSPLEHNGFVASIRSGRGLKRASSELRLTQLNSEMVGGLVHSSKSGKSLGILSGQWMQFQPDGPSVLRAWRYEDQQLSIPGTYFLISAAEIRKSLIKVLSETALDHRNVMSQQGQSVLITGELQLELFCPEASGGPSGDIRFPIGGIDMVGIGGESQARGCVIRASKADNPTAAYLSWLNHGELYEKLLAQVKLGHEVELHYIVKKTSEPGLPSIRTLLFNFESLQWGLEQGREALRLVFPSGSELPVSTPEDEGRSRLATEILKRSSNVFKNYRQSNASGTLELLREIYFIARVMQSENRQSLIDPAYFQRLLNDQYYERAWFFVTHSMTGGDPELRRLFEELL